MADTERRLVEALEANGLKLASRIDHSANAKRVDQSLPPTILLMFGNPRTGTPLIQQRRTVAIDLPLKMLIWEEDGKVKLAYNNSSFLAGRHTIDNSKVFTQIDELLASLARAATGL